MFVPAYPIAKYHSVTLSKYTVNVRSSVHLKPYPIDTPSPCPSLKVLSHWQPINSQTLRPVHSRIQQPNTQTRPFQNTKYLIAKYHFVTLSITQIPIPATANQRPIPVTWIWYGRRHVSVVCDRWCSQHSTHISVEYCDKYRIMSVVYDCLHFISYPIMMVQTLLWVMVEWSDVNVV